MSTTDNVIRPGDLFMIVKPKPCCGYSGGLGKVSLSIDRPPNSSDVTYCVHCNRKREVGDDYVFYTNKAHGQGYDLILRSRVIKINLPALEEGTKTEKEVNA